MQALTPETIEQYLSSLHARGLSQNTLRAYRADLTEFMRWAGPIPTPENFDTVASQYLTAYRKMVAPKTTGRRLTTLRSFARWLGLEILNGYRAPSAAKPIPHPLPEGVEGLHRIAEAARTVQQEALIGLCGFAGLRVGEALTVTVDDIDLPRSVILVHGKGDKRRNVPMSKPCWTYIASAYYAALPSGRLVTYGDRFARRAITECAERAGMKRHVSSHDLRATFATAVYDSTRDLRVTQELLGHTSPDTTQVYTAVAWNKMREAVKI